MNRIIVYLVLFFAFLTYTFPSVAVENDCSLEMRKGQALTDLNRILECFDSRIKELENKISKLESSLKNQTQKTVNEKDPQNTFGLPIGTWESIIEDEDGNFIPTYLHINECSITKYSAYIAHHGVWNCVVALKYSGNKGNRYVFTGIYDDRAKKQSGIRSSCGGSEYRRYDILSEKRGIIKVVYTSGNHPQWTYEFTNK